MVVHVVGNACIDTTFRLDRFPDAGETLNASDHSDGLGGKGANQAVAAARTGAEVRLWAAIGRDAMGARIRDALRSEIGGVQLTELDLPTDRSTIAVDARGENMIFSGVSCAKAFDPLRQTAFAYDIRPGDVVVLQGNLTPAATDACLRAARATQARTILNASPLPRSASIDLAAVDIVVVNEGEAQALTGKAAAPEAAAALVERGARSAIVTLGERGCLCLEGRNAAVASINAPTVAVVDTSGAGDVFCGVLAGGLACGLTLHAASRMAVGAAALAVTRAGTLASCPSADALSELMTAARLDQI